jgi:hypothetical protein
MTESCFKKKISDPPVCGVHNVAIAQRTISIDSNAPELGRITCYICPVSRAVVREGDGIQEAKFNSTHTQLHWDVDSRLAEANPLDSWRGKDVSHPG